MKIALLGPPAAGKGTLARLLEASRHLIHISTGDILREQMKNGTELGLEANRYIEQGNLVPDELVTKLVAHKLKDPEVISKGYMLDGFPRTKGQAEELDLILKESGEPLDIAIYMDATPELILWRITGRRVAPESGAIYHVTNRPPKLKGICDLSGEKLIQRLDDTEETVKKRMEVYLKNTLPIVQYYESKGILMKIDGDKQSEILLEELEKIFNERV